ncbi:MAG TPA: DUF4118 domain-containing protein [Candidatus Limnocylindrales bacterium]|nr:DUF4118 domain-containing protein [Candidatus Limnocylindrales bacterium]
MFSDTQKEQTPVRFRLSGRGASAVGALLCVLGAVLASAIADGHSWRSTVPLAFTIVLLAVAVIFGARAGIFGSVLSALVFAGFLFTPLGSFRVVNDAARTNLGWMLLIGISFSFLFAPSGSNYHQN